MRAVLLFSAVLHIATLGALAAWAMRAWVLDRRATEARVPQLVLAAFGLGGVVTVAGTIVMWMGRGFGHAFTTGLSAGVLAGLSFLLVLGVMPGRGMALTQYMRVSLAGLLGALILTEVIAFCFLVATAGTMAPFS